MSERAKLLVRLIWPDKGIRFKFGFDKRAEGVEQIITDDEI